MNVNVGKKRFPLPIHEHDEATELATHFCHSHDLPLSVTPQLTKLILHHKSEFTANASAEPQPRPVNKKKQFRHTPHPPSSRMPQQPSTGKAFRRGRSQRSQRTRRRRKRKLKRRKETSSISETDDEILEQFKTILDDHYRNSTKVVQKPKKTKKRAKPRKRRARSAPPRRRKPKKRQKRGSSGSRNGSKTTVFSRLYKEHSARQKKLNEKRELAVYERAKKYHETKVFLSKGSERLIHNKRKRGDVSVRLYTLARAKQKELKLRRKRKQEEEEALEDDFSFRPEISRRARSLKRSGSKLWKRIVDPMGDHLKNSVHDLRERIIQEEMDQCPFHPNVNSRSRSMVTPRRGVHERLYKNLNRSRSVEKSTSLSYKKKSFTFHPQISERSKELARLKRPKPPAPKQRKIRKGNLLVVKQNFLAGGRMLHENQKLRVVELSHGNIVVNNPKLSWGSHVSIPQRQVHKIEKQGKNLKRTLRDPQTGQQLFKPVISNNSLKLQKLKRDHVDNFDNIGSYLHEENIGNIIHEQPKHPFSPNLCEKSRNLTKSLNTERHHDIWNTISSNKETITIWNISNLSELRPPDAMVICQMLNTLVDKHNDQVEPILDFPTFCRLFDEYEALHPTGPRYNPKAKDLPSPEPAPTFAPIVSPKAQKLERHPDEIFDKLYEEADIRRQARASQVDEKFDLAKRELLVALNSAQANLKQTI